MSGILERIEAKLDQLLAQSGPPGLAQALAQGQQAVAQGQQAQPLAQQANLLGGASTVPQAAPTGQYPPATQEMIVALVTPLVNDPNTKAALQAEMHAMGVSALPDAQPHQYPELYYRFQQVQARMAQQQQAQPQAAATPASII